MATVEDNWHANLLSLIAERGTSVRLLIEFQAFRQKWLMAALRHWY
jgi:hypothetical protein